MRKIDVSIVYASKDQQWIKEITLQRGASIGDLLERSGFMTEIEDLVDQNAEDLAIGVYSQRAQLDDLLEHGDRVEIYRNLKADPKEVRRQLALLGKTVGKTK